VGVERQDADLNEQVRKSLGDDECTLQNATAQDVNDITAFLHTLPTPPPLQPATDDPADKEGAACPAAKSCSRASAARVCHVPPLTYTSPAAYDVGLRDEKGLDKFNPPSLRGVSQGYSFLHDGRAKELEEVFTVHGPSSSTAVWPMRSWRIAEVFEKSIVSPCEGWLGPEGQPRLSRGSLREPQPPNQDRPTIQLAVTAASGYNRADTAPPPLPCLRTRLCTHALALLAPGSRFRASHQPCCRRATGVQSRCSSSSTATARDCHSSEEKAAGLALDALVEGRYERHVEAWEKVVRKLQARADAAGEESAARTDETYKTVLAALGSARSIRPPSAQPNPGRTDTFPAAESDRIQNTIRDPLGRFEIDAAALLPADESKSRL